MVRGIGRRLGRRIGQTTGQRIGGLLGATGSSVAIGDRCPMSDTSFGCQFMRFGVQLDQILFVLLLLYALYYMAMMYGVTKSHRKS
jgi:hypothetical protein